MSLFTIFLIAFSLALDAFAVSVSAWLTEKKINIWKSLSLAFTFWLFQAVMPVLGWLGGVSVKSYIEDYDHWIAFILLGLIGINMIYEAFSKDEEEKRDYFHMTSLLTLWVATSIDALIIGISFALLPIKMVSSVMIIGLVTFVLCFIWVILWNRFGHLFEKKAEMFGGFILIAIGTKILVEHIFFP